MKVPYITGVMFRK